MTWAFMGIFAAWFWVKGSYSCGIENGARGSPMRAEILIDLWV